jgi:pimeloyl-ACP methyl ester carboxylesterase
MASALRLPPRQRAWQLRWRIGAISFALVLFAMYGGLVRLGAHVLTTPIRRPVLRTPESVGLAYQSISFPARHDGVPIAAWHMPALPANTSTQRVIIFVHGKDSCRSCEFRGRALNFAQAMHARGFAVLMLDLRNHGQSGNDVLTYGLREKNDILGAVDWLRAHGYSAGKIGVLGVSLGSASALYAAAEEAAIGAVVVDSGFADIRSVITQAATRFGWNGLNYLFAVEGVARLSVGANVLDALPMDQIQRIAPRPILFIHGGRDSLVPVSNAWRNATAAGTTPWIIPDAQHASIYPRVPEAYVAHVGNFFDAALLGS